MADPFTSDCPIEVESRETVFKGKWMGVDRVIFQYKKHIQSPNPSDIPKGLWECAYRTTKPATAETDGVNVIPILKEADGSKSMILIKQYRVPIMNYCIEFPAGLLDPKESTETAALRELKEETGYVGSEVVFLNSGVLPLDCGLSDSNIKFAIVKLDGTLPDNINPKQNLDTTEDISVIKIPMASLKATLDTYLSQNIQVDASLYALCIGLALREHFV